jgi:hypothetical protein
MAIKKTALVLLCAALALPSCGISLRNKDVVLYDGVAFRSKAKKVDKDRTHFTAEVRDAAQSIPGALEAGRHAGVTYCIKNYGSSKIDWVKGPDIDPADVVLEGGDLTFEGYCKI